MTEHSRLCNVAILAGGMGTRLRSRTGNLPKPMAPVLDRPVLEHLIDLCVRHGFHNIALLVHYEHETIRSHFGDGHRFGAHLHYCVETDARGTAGALLDSLPSMDSRFLVLYGDTYADVNLKRLWNAHLESDADATLLLHPNDHPQDSDLVEVDTNGRITAIHPYPHPVGSTLSNLVNAAMYVMNRQNLDTVIPATGRFDLAKHTFPAMLAAQQCLRAYVTPEYIKDMGTPERLDKVARDIVAGLPEKLSDRQLRRAIFIDRDGTINREVNHLNSPEQLELLDGAGEAIRKLNRSGTLAICVTNQPVISRGEVNEAGMRAIHSRLDQLLGDHHAYLDALYLCPHHPDKGFAGEVPELKIRCNCRKPETGLIDHAVRDLHISRRDSWMVGDSTSDIRAGRDAGLSTVLIRSGYAGEDGKYPDIPDFVMPDLAAAIEWVLEGHPRMMQRLLPTVPMALSARIILIGGPARAGKTSAARCLSEQLQLLGKTTHIISLDGWLKPADQRQEGTGVLKRYDMVMIRSIVGRIKNSTDRVVHTLPIYSRAKRESQSTHHLSVGPDDIVIVEGVPALLDDELLSIADLRLFIDIDDEQRKKRLELDYCWRPENQQESKSRINSREIDEVPTVKTSAIKADFVISGQAI